MENSSDLVIDLDLNEEPLESSLGLLLVEIDGYHARIEERIRQLEAVTARARERLSLRLNSMAAAAAAMPASVPIPNPSSEEGVNGEIGVVVVGGGCEGEKRGEGSGGASLIARALASASPEEKKAGSGEGGFYDCNVCLAMAREPVLTCCGHLYCWPCFCKLPFVSSNSTVRECPACNGEVGDDNIIPIYGNGSEPERKDGEEAGFKIPARPHAHRVESTRQWRVPRFVPRFVMDERFRQTRTRFRVMLQGDGEAGTSLSGRAPAAPVATNVVPDDEADVRSPRPSGGGFFSFPSVGGSGHASSSSAFDSVERSGDNMESYDREQVMRAWTESLLADDRDAPASNSGAGPSRTQVPDAGRETLPLTVQDDAADIGQLGTQPAVTVEDIAVATTRRSSTSRRRASDDGGASPDSRRRRIEDVFILLFL